MQAEAHAAAAATSSAAIDDLFQRYHERVFRVAFRVTGSASDAEDVLQTVFLRLLRRETVPDLSPSPGSYLHRAATNAALDVLRGRVSARQVPIEEAGLRLRVARSQEPDRQFDQKVLRERLRKAIAALPARAAEMFVLRYFEGCEAAEIARQLRTSRGVVAVTLFRARQRLRRDLREITGD